MKNRTPEEKKELKKKIGLVIVGWCLGIITLILITFITTIICKATGLI